MKRLATRAQGLKASQSRSIPTRNLPAAIFLRYLFPGPLQIADGDRAGSSEISQAHEGSHGVRCVSAEQNTVRLRAPGLCEMCEARGGLCLSRVRSALDVSLLLIF
jgi:hypothetical protein